MTPMYMYTVYSHFYSCSIRTTAIAETVTTDMVKANISAVILAQIIAIKSAEATLRTASIQVNPIRVSQI